MGNVINFYFVSLQPEEFEVKFVELPDGGVEVRSDITRRTREALNRQAARHGMTLDERLAHDLRQSLPVNDR